MAEAFVELGAEAVNHLTDKHFDSGYDRYRKWVNGKKVESVVTPYRRDRDREGEGAAAGAAAAEDAPPSRSGRKSSGDLRSAAQSEASRQVRSSAGGAPDALTATSAGQTRRRHRSTLPSPERDIGTGATAAAAGAAAGYTYSSTSRRNRSLERQSITSDRVLREYERETDDPPCRPEKVLTPSQLQSIPPTTAATTRTLRRDSAMASNYGADTVRPRSQPPRSSRYDDDYDSDYDERTGRRSRATGRGYDDRDDRDYDRVIEETERYRGPVGAGPLPFTRRESYRSNYDDDRTYAGGAAVTQYDKRRSGDYERSERDTYLSRRESRRDRDYDSRSRSRSRDGGWKEKLENTFDTSTQGIGVGIAGAVIGGLAGREFGSKGKTSQRDIAIGALIGGLGANIAENKYREWKDRKEDRLERAEDRWEQKWDGRDIGRSRSNVR